MTDLSPNHKPNQNLETNNHDNQKREIQDLEKQISTLINKVETLRREMPVVPVNNYSFQTLEGTVNLLDLFGDKEVLFAIHNMGQGCRYCTLWADGINAFLPHFEDKFAVVLLSKDAPTLQRQFANSRQWRFRLASHGGGEYLTEQSVTAGEKNMPGVVCYTRKGNQVFRKNTAVFGPGDLFCSFWHFLALAGESESTWYPQFNYWQAPKTLDDGGKNAK